MQPSGFMFSGQQQFGSGGGNPSQMQQFLQQQQQQFQQQQYRAPQLAGSSPMGGLPQQQGQGPMGGGVDLTRYRKVQKGKEPTPDGEVRITANGHVSAYVSYIGKAFYSGTMRQVHIRAQGNALDRAVRTAEIVKLRFKGVHQECSVGNVVITDEYEPIEPASGLQPLSTNRNVAYIDIILSLDDNLDKTSVGYQAPIPEELVIPFDPTDPGCGASPRGVPSRMAGSPGMAGMVGGGMGALGMSPQMAAAGFMPYALQQQQAGMGKGGGMRQQPQQQMSGFQGFTAQDLAVMASYGITPGQTAAGGRGGKGVSAAGNMQRGSGGSWGASGGAVGFPGGMQMSMPQQQQPQMNPQMAAAVAAAAAANAQRTQQQPGTQNQSQQSFQGYIGGDSFQRPMY